MAHDKTPLSVCVEAVCIGAPRLSADIVSTAIEAIGAWAGIAAEAGTEGVDEVSVLLVSDQFVGLLARNKTVGWASTVDIFRDQWFFRAACSASRRSLTAFVEIER